MKDKMPKGAKIILEKLNSYNHEAYLVGGCVRDFLMGEIPKDWDITTSASPKEVKELFSEYKLFEFGIKHGTISIIIEGNSYEVTTYREDGEYLDSRRPETINFTKSLSQDLKRRDFTINAMAMNSKGDVVDLYNGEKDLNSKFIRCVGNPKERIGEDALRILRALRFAARMGFQIEQNTSDAINSEKNLLLKISLERINDEFDKILHGEYATNILREYRDVIAVFIPEIKELFDFEQCNPYHIYDVYEHTLKAVEEIENCDNNRLMAFLHDIAKPRCFIIKDGWGHFYHHESKGAELAKIILNRLRYDNKTIDDIAFVIKTHGTVFNPDIKYARHKLNQMGEKRLRMLMALEKADVKAQNPQIIMERLDNIKKFESCVDTVIEEKHCFSVKDLNIDGNDLIELGYTRGPFVGKALNDLLIEVMNEDIINDKKILIKRAIEKLNILKKREGE